MGMKEQEFFAKDRFVVMGNTRRMRNTVDGLKKLGKTVYFVDESFPSDRGARRFPTLAALPDPVDAAICDGPPDRMKSYIGAVKDAGIPSIWLNFESDKPEVVSLAKGKGLEVLHGQCAVIWAPAWGPHHSIHRLLWKILGKY